MKNQDRVVDAISGKHKKTTLSAAFHTILQVFGFSYIIVCISSPRKELLTYNLQCFKRKSPSQKTPKPSLCAEL